MRRFRRPLVWLPLVVLMLPLLALGWRNWHLSMDEEEVWSQVPSVFASQTNFVFRTGIGRFLPGQSTVVGIKSTSGQPAPVSPALFAQFKKIYPQMIWVNATRSPQKSNAYFLFGKSQFRGRFAAQCQVFYASRVAPDAQFVTASETFYFARSPVSFRDNTWHSKGLGNMGYIYRKPRLP